MTTPANVVRYHLVRWTEYLLLPAAFLGIVFAVNLVIFALVPLGHSTSWVLTAHGLVRVVRPSKGRDTGGLSVLLVMFPILGGLSMFRSLPFALTLGMSRRAYYTGTALLGTALAAVYAVGITALQAIERATGSWGVTMHFFEVPYLLEGPWYLTLVTSFVALALLFSYGMWIGIVYRRWSLFGIVTFVAVQVIALSAAAMAITGAHAWPNVGRFFTTVDAAGLTGLLAVLVAVLLTGGLTTVRRATV
jgi:hypothetical protein